MQSIAAAAEPETEFGTKRSRGTGKSERLWILAAGGMVVIQLWFGMISTSFWLDETGTWWIVKDGAAEAVRRAMFWSGQSPLFYLIEWCSGRLFGLNEIALRIPSVLATCGALFFLYRIARRLLNRASAGVVTFVFLCVVSFYAIDARPYALALFFLAVSCWALLQWLETYRTRDAVIYIVAAALVVYAHCVMSLGLGGGVIYAVAVTRSDPRRRAMLGGFLIAVALLCLPLAAQLRTFYGARSSHMFTGIPGTQDLLAGLIPCSVAGAFILLVWTLTFRREAGAVYRFSQFELLIGSWALFSPFVLFLLAVFTDLRLYVPKYYSSALPGQALFAGGLLSSIRSGALRKSLIVVVAVIAIVSDGRLTFRSHGNEDWRAAMKFLRKEAGPAPVLLVSGFVEASDFTVLRDPKRRGIFFAPELFYGEPETGIGLPNRFDGRDWKEMERIAARLEGESRFYLLTENPDRSYEMWLRGRLGAGCRSESTGESFGYIWISRFTCE